MHAPENLSTALLKKLAELLRGGVQPVAPDSPVRATATLALGAYFECAVREYEGFVGRDPNTGAPVDVAPRLLLQFDATPEYLQRLAEARQRSTDERTGGDDRPTATSLDGVFDEGAEALLHGHETWPVAHIGQLSVVTRERAGTVRYFVRFAVDPAFEERLQQAGRPSPLGHGTR